MHLTYREWWSLVHGFVFGGGFLLSFAGVVIVLYGLRREDLTDRGLALHVLWLRIGSAAMAVAAWGTVILGTWVMYPWYRSGGAKAGLLSSSQTSNWDKFGMEWKQHVAWLAPPLGRARWRNALSSVAPVSRSTRALCVLASHPPNRTRSTGRHYEASS